MVDKPFKCNYCEKRFGRKWNAMRHNNLVHSNAATITSYKNQPSGYPNKPQDNPYYLYSKIFDCIERASSKDVVFLSEYLGVFKLDHNGIKIIKIIDQLIKPYQELKINLDKYQERTKLYILTNALEISLNTHNPVTSMNNIVEIFRSIQGINEMAKDLEQSGKALSNPIDSIRRKIMESSIFKRRNN